MRILLIVLLLSVVGCSSVQKQKLNAVMADVKHAVEVLNDKYCAETNEALRGLIIQQIKFYVPIYPAKGYCLFVEDDEDAK